MRKAPGGRSGEEAVCNQQMTNQSNKINYRQKLIREGTYANQRAHMIQEESLFYQKLQKKFKTSQKTFKIQKGNNTTTNDIEISMIPLNLAKIKGQKEQVLPGASLHEPQIDSMAGARSQQHAQAVDQDLPSICDKEEENLITEILETGDEPHVQIDRAQIKDMHIKLISSLFNEWSVKNVNLSNKTNLLKLELYQPALRKMVFECQMLNRSRKRG